ncbi:MAG: uroporphyrinogen decarboxylase [candidate division NC10 bacterium]|jgi:uroporphyrinogen decarboxylase
MRDRILKAARREPVDTTPIWIMRQAGRYLPEYRELRKKYAMEEICRTPELTVEATLQPLRRFDLDAAILFSDLLVPLWGMGIPFDLVEGKGPVLRKALTPAELAALPPLDLAALEFNREAIRILRRELDRPLIGFTGGPFTFVSYLIEGQPSRDYPKTRAFLHAHPREWKALMKRLAENLALYLRAQIEAGVQMVQVFDSWVGVLSPEDFRESVKPYVIEQLEQVGKSVPRIYFSTASAHLFSEFATLPAEVIGVDWRVPLTYAKGNFDAAYALQGNLDPSLLLGREEELFLKTANIIEEGRALTGHIFNLGHGILPATPPERVKRLVDFVHTTGERR